MRRFTVPLVLSICATGFPLHSQETSSPAPEEPAKEVRASNPETEAFLRDLRRYSPDGLKPGVEQIGEDFLHINPFAAREEALQSKEEETDYTLLVDAVKAESQSLVKSMLSGVIHPQYRKTRDSGWVAVQPDSPDANDTHKPQGVLIFGSFVFRLHDRIDFSGGEQADAEIGEAKNALGRYYFWGLTRNSITFLYRDESHGDKRVRAGFTVDVRLPPFFTHREAVARRATAEES